MTGILMPIHFVLSMKYLFVRCTINMCPNIGQKGAIWNLSLASTNTNSEASIFNMHLSCYYWFKFLFLVTTCSQTILNLSVCWTYTHNRFSYTCNMSLLFNTLLRYRALIMSLKANIVQLYILYDYLGDTLQYNV